MSHCQEAYITVSALNVPVGILPAATSEAGGPLWLMWLGLSCLSAYLIRGTWYPGVVCLPAWHGTTPSEGKDRPEQCTW
ncbi:hypothetical protein LY76DRAFT_323679 [Colletotrichum caudatum]|nr:hypothetical protein LY76DRAFT_323679 [Colletotrichum caudatum]